MQKNTFNPKMLLVPMVLAFAVLGFNTAKAQDISANQAKIIFPIAELGDCANASDCRTYCNDLNNVEACSTFGRNHGLITAIQAEANLKFKEFKTGPGNCTSKEACRTYCENTANTDECVAFAKQHKLSDEVELEKFRKFQVALKKGETPGDCTSKEACRTYCENTDHAEECTKFAEERGLVEKEHAQQIRKFHEAIKSGETPGDCTSKEACRTYCENEDHRAECADFASSQGLIKQEHAKRLKEGVVGPGGCTSKEACEVFCKDEANHQVCLDFAKEHKVIKVHLLEKIEAETKAKRDVKENESTDPTKEQKDQTSDSPSADIQRHSNVVTLSATVRECVVKNFGLSVAQRIQNGEAGTPAQVREKIAKCLSEPATIKRAEPRPLPPIKIEHPVSDSSSLNDDITGIVPEPFNSQQ